MTWKETENTSNRRSQRRLPTGLHPATACLSASESNGDWKGSSAELDLRVIVRKDGGDMAAAQAVLDRVAPLAEQILHIMGEYKDGE